MIDLQRILNGLMEVLNMISINAGIVLRYSCYQWDYAKPQPNSTEPSNEPTATTWQVTFAHSSPRTCCIIRRVIYSAAGDILLDA